MTVSPGAVPEYGSTRETRYGLDPAVDHPPLLDENCVKATAPPNIRTVPDVAATAAFVEAAYRSACAPPADRVAAPPNTWQDVVSQMSHGWSAWLTASA